MLSTAAVSTTTAIATSRLAIHSRISLEFLSRQRPGSNLVDQCGPVIKNKLFFFADYQGTKQQQGITNKYTVPTATVLSTCGAGKPGNCDLSEYLVARGAINGQIFDPKSGNTSTGTGRTAFANNQIPNSRISQQATAILALFAKAVRPVPVD